MSAQALTPEVLDGIKPFSGLPEKTGMEGILAGGGAIQRVQTPYTTAVAVQKPRSISRVAANVLEEAKLAGSSFYYGWAANKKGGGTERIEGPSIDLAMCLARNYGNCAIDIQDMEESLTHYKLMGAFIDLESGFTCPRLFRQRKAQNIGMKDTDRAEDITYQIGQSKVIRNAIVRAMPAWLIEQAIETAKGAELSKIKPENIAIARAKSFDFFRQYGVNQERIEAKVGRKMDEWTAQDIVDLRGMATALKEGRVSATELFPLEVKTDPVQPAEKADKKGKKKDEEKPAETVQGANPEAWKCPFLNCETGPVKATCDQECDEQARADCPMYPQA